MLIRDERLKRALIKALADDYASKILSNTVIKGRSVNEIIKECGIPHTSAYRIVNELKEQGLLTVEKIVHSKDGKKYSIYKSTFRSVSIRFEGGDLQVEAEPNRDIIDKAFRLFYSLRGEGEKGG